MDNAQRHADTTRGDLPNELKEIRDRVQQEREVMKQRAAAALEQIRCGARPAGKRFRLEGRNGDDATG